MRDLAGPLRGQRFCVALSGGLDSTVLLDALASVRARSGFRLRALHVDHGLQPDSSAWALSARARARACGVECEVLRVRIRLRRGDSLEAIARERRYGALRAHLGSDETLLTAHHQDDQLETLLLALMRGSGVRGLCGMSGSARLRDVRVLRPLLPVSRESLEQYARARRLSWVEDPSNADERFDRNYLRRRVVPALRARWPAAAALAARTAQRLAEVQALLDAQAAHAAAAAADGEALRVTALRGLTEAARRNVLRHWIVARGLPSPDHRRLCEIAGPLLSARADANPLVRWPGGALRRFGDRLLAGAPAELSEPARALRSGDWDWRRRAGWSLGERATLALVRDRHGDVDLARLPCPLRVEFRAGGEHLRGSRGALALKDLLQAAQIAPWDRARVPLLVTRDGIIAVGDLWLDAAYRAAADCSGPRARLLWRRASAHAH